MKNYLEFCTWHTMYWQFSEDLQPIALCHRFLQDDCIFLLRQKATYLCTVHHLLVTAVLPGFETFHWFIECQFMIDFAFLKFNSFFSSALMINEEKKRYFCISTAEYSGIHLLYKWHFMSINKTGVKLVLRLFWRMKHITITT